jgi:intracellular sulfur oxidation DsrE/DsrF family protein
VSTFTQQRRRTMRRILTAVGLVAALFISVEAAQADHVKDGRKVHKLVFQVNVDDPKTWNLTLNNINNVITELGKDGVDIKLVTYGPGINMFRKGKSTVLERLDSLKKSNDKVIDYTVCSNTMKNMKVEKNEIAEFVHDMYPGIVRIMELQEGGYVYIRP